MKAFKKAAAALLAAALLVTCFAGCSKKDGGGDYTSGNTEFVIGATGPLTGGASVYGLAVQNSAQMAIDEINAAGGLNGVNFKLIMLDDKNDASTIATNYASLIESGMQVSLGTVTTAPGLEFKNLANEDNVFFLTPSASGDAIPEFDNGYQMCFADGNQGAAAAQYVNENLAGQTIGVLYKSDDPYSTGILDQFKENLDDSITLTEASFMGETVASFDSQVNILKDCKFIFMPIYYTPAAQFMVQAKNVIAADAVYYGCDGLDGIETGVKGFDIYTIPQEISYLSHFNSKATEGPAAEFIKKYVEKHGSETLNQFGASAYDCVYAIYGAMKQKMDEGETIDVTIGASDLCEILKSVFNGGYTFTGVTGEYADGKQSSISWETNGYVNKSAVKYIVKEAGAQKPAE